MELNKKTNELTMSEEDLLLTDDEDKAKNKPNTTTNSKRSTKDKRRQLTDANRLRANSLDDLSRLKQSTLHFGFNRQMASATSACTATTPLNTVANVDAMSNESSGKVFVFGSVNDGAGTSSTSFMPTQANANSETEQSIQNNENKKSATLKDVKQILDSNKGIINAASKHDTNIRPTLGATSTPNSNEGGAKKRRRGGKKVRAML